MGYVTRIRLADSEVDLTVDDVSEDTWNGWTVPYVTLGQAQRLFATIAADDLDAEVPVVSGSNYSLTLAHTDVTVVYPVCGSSDETDEPTFRLDGYCFVDPIHHPDYFPGDTTLADLDPRGL